MNIVLTVKKAIKLIDLKLGVKKIEPILQSKVVNPNINEQNITPDTNYNGLSNVVVNGVNSSIDSNIQSGNIKDGVSILGVTGNYKLDGSEYFYDTLETSPFSWTFVVKKIPRFELVAPSSGLSFSGFSGEYIDVSGIDTSNVASISSCFSSCAKLKEIDISMWNLSNLSAFGNLFYNCTSLEKCDVRNVLFSNYTISSRRGVFNKVPDNCLIIVKDETEKAVVLNNFQNLTNVKTVEEYENQ